MIDECRATEKTYYQARPTGHQVAEHSESNSRCEFKPVQPHQLGIASKISNFRQISVAVPAGEYPAEVAVQKTLVSRGMNVLRGIRMQVVVWGLGRPPQHALFGGRLGQQCKQKLECRAGGIGSGG